MYQFFNNHCIPVRAILSFQKQYESIERTLSPIITHNYSSLAEATQVAENLKSQVWPLSEYMSRDNLAPTDECLIFGYGYGTGEVKSPIRETDEFDDQLFIRPWPAANTEDFNKILYHNTWRTFTYTFNTADDFRLYVKYGNGYGSAYIRNLEIDGQEAAIYPDMNADIVEFDSGPAVILPSDWSKGFLINDGEGLTDGEHTVSFEYYIESPVQYNDPPATPHYLYVNVTVTAQDTSDCDWMEGLYFESPAAADAAYEIGEQAYLRSLPDTNARLTKQVTALELAVVDIYESLEG